MAAPTDGVTKASIWSDGTGYTGNNAAHVNGSTDLGATAGFLGELRYSSSQDKVWVRARWNNNNTHPSGAFLLASNKSANAQPCGFYVDLQAEMKRSNGTVYWLTVTTWAVKNTTQSAGTYSDTGFKDPDTITESGAARTNYFRVRIRTGVFNGYADGNNNATYNSPKVKVK